jgi:hypothetical protein
MGTSTTVAADVADDIAGDGDVGEVVAVAEVVVATSISSSRTSRSSPMARQRDGTTRAATVASFAGPATAT